jgi:alkanesulfonate monooxygenase SsuD/methylene tetrahydromethanopterin reductase-like flavin-dependent oxidoreductase (luciferase family)
VGGREEDYRAVDAGFEKRLSRLERQVATMRRTWAGEPPFPGAAPVGPRPIQAGGPEILSGSLNPASIRRAARWADGVCGFSFQPSAEEVAAGFEAARHAWREVGRAKPPRLVTSCWFALDPDGRAAMDAYVGRYLGIFGSDLAAEMARQCTTTSAAALSRVIREIADAGADELILVPTTGDPDCVDRVADLIG